MAGVVIGLVLLIGILVLLSTIQHYIIIVPPNMAAVITGRQRKIVAPDGSEQVVGYRTVIGGRTFRIPVLEQVHWLSLETIPIDVTVTNAYSRGNIPLKVHAIANVKIASQPESVFNNAVERLLGKTTEEIRSLAQETLVGNLRGVLATLSPEEVNEDRLAFAQRISEEADQDLMKLGLHIDTLKIQNVSDEVGYLEAIGRQKTAEVLKAARVAEAENNKLASVSEAEAEIEIVEAQNRLRVRKAELDQEALSKEKVAVVEARRAEVEAQTRLEQSRVEMQRKRAEADIVVPAEADKEAAIRRAEGEAAPIRARGQAQAEALRAIFAEMKDAGNIGVGVLLIEKLPALLEQAVRAVEGIDVDRVFVMDGGSGTAMANVAAQRVRGAIGLLEGLAGATGLDLEQILRKAVGSETS